MTKYFEDKAVKSIDKIYRLHVTGYDVYDISKILGIPEYMVKRYLEIAMERVDSSMFTMTLENLINTMEQKDQILEVWINGKWEFDTFADSIVIKPYLHNNVASFGVVLVNIDGDPSVRLKVSLYEEWLNVYI